MNILASYNWIKEYLDTDLSADEFARLTTAAGNSVERMHDVADAFDHMVVGLVKEVRVHPNADKLRIAMTDIGKETVEIVCGGINLAEGMRVVVGLPGARVRWHGEGELIELKKTTIRGVESTGMICAVDEIGFEVLSTGKQDIWDISSLTEAKPGTSIAEALDLNDVIFDIEVTSNRPDCKSIIGQAREGSAVTNGIFTAPTRQQISMESGVSFSVEVKEPELCPMYSAVLMDHVKVGPSPWWLQKKLILAGFRPINNIVDITNLVLHEYGQPLHAFDADKLEGEKIVVRKAKSKESLLALDGKTYELSSDMLVIADAKKPVAVAGVMGGELTGTTASTTRVLIESASFDPVSVRRTARALNLYSDSQLLFEKGLSSQATGPAIERAMQLIREVAGGSLVSDVVVEEAQPYTPRVFPFDPKAANRLMGIELQEEEMIALLGRLGFACTQDGDHWSVTVPYWRDHDIEESVDFTEEIARVYGYEQFPSVLPEGKLPTNRDVPALQWVQRIKQLLCGMGLSELYSYSFISKAQLEKSGWSTEQAVRLRNPLSSEFEFMRPSLLPSMLSSVEVNQSRLSQADVFELAPVYLPQKNDLPLEPLRLLLTSYGKDGREIFLRAKGFLERLFRQTGIQHMELVRGGTTADYHPSRSAQILVDGKSIGMIGQISQERAKAFGIDVEVVCVDLDFETLVPQFTTAKSYSPLPEFPSVKRDLACVVSERVEYAQLVAELQKESSLLASVELFDVYRGKGVEEGMKSLALHLEFRSPERTLESKEVDTEMETFRSVLQKTFGAILRS